MPLPSASLSIGAYARTNFLCVIASREKMLVYTHRNRSDDISFKRQYELVWRMQSVVQVCVADSVQNSCHNFP